MKNIDELTFAELQRIHRKYQELASLTKTCTWLEEAGIKTNRYRLSVIFKRNGFDVKPPNGRQAQFWRDTTLFTSPYGKFAAANFRAIWEDIFHWLQTSTGRLNYMSACICIGTPFYEAVVGTLAQGVENMSVSQRLPPGITAENIQKGRELYEDLYTKWVLSDE